MKQLITIVTLILLTGCNLLPKSHDPMMFNQLITVDITIKKVDCNNPDWKLSLIQTQHLSQYTTWRNDPQSVNINGLYLHIERLSEGGSKTFCELGKKTAASRILATKIAWEGR
jgi:hypothetical protein